MESVGCSIPCVARLGQFCACDVPHFCFGWCCAVYTQNEKIFNKDHGSKLARWENMAEAAVTEGHRLARSASADEQKKIERHVKNCVFVRSFV